MADAADSTPATGGQFALTVADLNTVVNHEPRVEDVRLASALGFDRPWDIRKLIERHREALERLGEVCATVAQTSAGISATVAQNTQPRKRGRPGRTFWLNKRQALYLCTKSETPRATETTIAMVEVFDAHLAARAAKPVAVAGHSRALPKERRARAIEPAPASDGPTVERDGFALVRLGGESVLVDLFRYDVPPGARAVRLHKDGRVSVGTVDMRGAPGLDERRAGLETPPQRKPGLSSTFQELVRVVGTVVASQPAAAPGAKRGAKPRAAKPPRPRGALPARLPDLAMVEARGTA